MNNKKIQQKIIAVALLFSCIVLLGYSQREKVSTKISSSAKVFSLFNSETKKRLDFNDISR